MVESDAGEVISDQDRTQRFVVTAIYELPLARASELEFLERNRSRIISGCKPREFIRAERCAPGLWKPIFLGNCTIFRLRMCSHVDRWFNGDAGFERNSALQPSQNLRILSSRFSGIRADGANNLIWR